MHLTALSTEIGRVLREVRESAGLTPAQLAKRLGVVEETVRRVERGTGGVTAKNIARWCAVCDVTWVINRGTAGWQIKLTKTPPAAS